MSENIKIRNLNVYPKFNKSSLVKFQDNYIEKLKSSNYLKILRIKINKDKTLIKSKIRILRLEECEIINILEKPMGQLMITSILDYDENKKNFVYQYKRLNSYHNGIANEIDLEKLK